MFIYWNICSEAILNFILTVKRITSHLYVLLDIIYFGFKQMK